MKMTLTFPGLPPVIIDASAAECAELLAVLGERYSSSAVYQQKTLRPNDVSYPEKKERSSHFHKVPLRTDAGHSNRRGMMLRVFETLAKEGSNHPSLRELKTRFTQMFPNEDTHNLDQVVRDLANKTPFVERKGRGCFALESSD